jgi:hypothetical protein
LKQQNRRSDTQVASQQQRLNEIRQELDRTIYSFEEQRNSEMATYDQYAKEMANKLVTL